jgi:predicted metal-binding membrane protein
MATTMSDGPSALERMVKRDRMIVAAGLAAIIMLAWIRLVSEAGSMQAMAMDTRMHAAMGMADLRAWGLSDWFALFIMWAVMMAGMMLPSAAPVILLALAVYRRRGNEHARVSAVAFVSGYLVVWTTFSAAAAAAQIGLHQLALLTPDMAASSATLAGALLLMAGLYQWLPIKNACLTQCQSPLGFLTQHWQEQTTGALKMGLKHGLFCVGCCWALMALLFVVGVMNLLWVAVIAVFVLAEKMLPQGAALGRVTGMVLVGWGIYAFVT